VSQEEPQGVHVHAVLQTSGGEVVAKSVGTAAASHPGPPLQSGEHDLDGVDGHGLPVVGQPDRVAAFPTLLVKVEFQGLSGLAVEWHRAMFVPLAQDAALLQMGFQLGELHLGQLGQAQAGIDEDGDHGLVADAQVAVTVLDVELADA